MSTARAETPAAAPSGTATPPQWWALTRLFVRDALSYLLTTTLVMLACIVVASLVARWRGWTLVTELGPEGVRAAVAVDEGGVTVVASLSLVVAAASIAALVSAIVLAARTRVHVGAGATRASVALALLVTVAVMTAYVLVVTAVLFVVAGGGVDGAAETVRSELGTGLAVASVRGTGAVLLWMLGGIAITALFLRWPWWVGTVALTVLFVVLPIVVEVVLGVEVPLAGLRSWWGLELLAAVVVGAVAWWIGRRIPVR